MKIEDKSGTLYNFKRFGDCILYPESWVPCERWHNCTGCDVAGRYRANVKPGVHPLLSHSDALPQTKSGCSVFLNKALILKPEAMKRLGLEEDLKYQIVIPFPSPGLFPSNPTGFIDCRFLCEDLRTFTVYRNEVYGVPNAAAVRKYDDIYFLNLKRYV